MGSSVVGGPMKQKLQQRRRSNKEMNGMFASWEGGLFAQPSQWKVADEVGS